MQIVINIPEDEYELVRHGNKSYRTELVLMNAVAEGTQLPKGHGRLIDADELCKQPISSKAVLDAPIIIEADKEGEND